MIIPGSKSIANRVLLLAAMADGISEIAGLPDNDDARAAFSAIHALGIATERIEAGTYRIAGCAHDIPNRSRDIDIRSAGTVGRFLPGLLASAAAGEWRLLSTPQLARRPLEPLLEGLRAWGGELTQERDGCSFPLAIKGSGLAGGPVDVSARASSQFASGLLMCAPFCGKDAVVRIHELDPQEKYIDITIDIMRRFGAEVEPLEPETNGRVSILVRAPSRYRAANLHVEADLNSALNFLALPLLLGGRATVANAVGDSAQPGAQFLKMATRLGGVVSTGPFGVSVASEGAPPRGGFAVDMRAMSEMALSLAVIAVFADAPITMTNLGHIRNHETDRLAAISEILAEAGVSTEQGPDWVTVIPLPRERLKNAVIDSRDDHRVVMALALLGLAGNGVTITNAGAVAKTFPDFFTRLRGIGAETAGG